MFASTFARAKLLKDILQDADVELREEKYNPSGKHVQYAPLLPPDPSVLQGADFPAPPQRLGSVVCQQLPEIDHPRFWRKTKFRLHNTVFPPYKRYKDDSPFQRIDSAYFTAFQSNKAIDQRWTSKNIIACDEVPHIPYFRRPDKQSTPHLQAIWPHYNIVHEEMSRDQMYIGWLITIWLALDAWGKVSDLTNYCEILETFEPVSLEQMANLLVH